MHDAFCIHCTRIQLSWGVRELQVPFQLRFSHLVKDFSLSSFENGIHTLLNDIIVDLTHIDLIP
jgi:hypothetical protein